MGVRAFRILSIDGGGIRGAFAASFLASIERKIGRPICDYFDLIAGTSTGAIIAMALALGEPSSRVQTLYEQHGPGIFTRPNRRVPWSIRAFATVARSRVPGLDAAWLIGTKYSAAPLASVLRAFFADRTLEDAKRRLLVPAIDLTKGQPVVFKTPHLPGLDRDRHFRAADVVLATTAAPSYFPHATILPGSSYCDGGLWANNPSVLAIAEACQIQQQCRRPDVDPSFGINDIALLSIGTGTDPYFLDAPADEADGLLFWALRLLDVSGISQSQGMTSIAQYLLGGGRHLRIDFTIPKSGWRLDAIEALERLIHLGREEAEKRFTDLRPLFLQAPALPFTAFPRPSPATEGADTPDQHALPEGRRPSDG